MSYVISMFKFYSIMSSHVAARNCPQVRISQKESYSILVSTSKGC